MDVVQYWKYKYQSAAKKRKDSVKDEQDASLFPLVDIPGDLKPIFVGVERLESHHDYEAGPLKQLN